jgi:SAM-dependent methyltransferase
MLEVDGKVVSPHDLIRRVQEVLANTETEGVELVRPTSPAALTTEQALATTTQRVQGLQYRLSEIHPPDVPAAAGAVGTAKRFSKRAIRKATRWYVEPRWHSQTDFDAEATQFAAAANHAIAELDGRISEVRAYTRRIADRNRILAHDTKDIGTTIAAARTTIAEAQSAIADLQRQVAELDSVYVTKDELKGLHGEVQILLERLGAASAAGADIDYVAFEDRFRGSSDQLKAIQSDYVRFFPGPEVPGRVVDIGCGRGEMIEVLLDAGFEAVGVDPDEGMVAVCREKGLDVAAANGLTWLDEQPNDSLKGVFCAQVVEHLFTSELQALVRRAHAKLAAGGVLIMETINPRSLHALSNHFFADTSHIRPVHPETLRFICEEAGYGQVHLLELSRHPRADLPDDMAEGAIRDVLAALVESVYGCQDYAIIAYK